MSKEKALQIHVLMGFKPMTKYFPAFEISNKKTYEILKQRASGISKKSHNILAFMGFRPMTSKSKYFPAYEISKESLENSGFHGI